MVARTARKRRPGSSRAIPNVITEHNLQARYRNGAVAVEVGEEPDSPNRRISRARVVNAADALHGCAAISRVQHLACEKYLLLRGSEVGAKWRNGEIVVRSNDPTAKGWPVFDQVAAATALRRVHAIIGLRGRVLVELLTVENFSVPAIAARLGRTDKVTGERVAANSKHVMGELSGVLTRLVEF